MFAIAKNFLWRCDDSCIIVCLQCSRVRNRKRGGERRSENQTILFLLLTRSFVSVCECVCVCAAFIYLFYTYIINKFRIILSVHSNRNVGAKISHRWTRVGLVIFFYYYFVQQCFCANVSVCARVCVSACDCLCIWLRVESMGYHVFVVNIIALFVHICGCKVL